MVGPQPVRARSPVRVNLPRLAHHWPLDDVQLHRAVADLPHTCRPEDVRAGGLPGVFLLFADARLVEQKLVMEGRPAASTLVRDSHHLAALRVKLQRNEAVRDGLVAVARTSCHALHLRLHRSMRVPGLHRAHNVFTKRQWLQVRHEHNLLVARVLRGRPCVLLLVLQRPRTRRHRQYLADHRLASRIDDRHRAVRAKRHTHRCQTWPGKRVVQQHAQPGPAWRQALHADAAHADIKQRALAKDGCAHGIRLALVLGRCNACRPEATAVYRRRWAAASIPQPRGRRQQLLHCTRHHCARRSPAGGQAAMVVVHGVLLGSAGDAVMVLQQAHRLLQAVRRVLQALRSPHRRLQLPRCLQVGGSGANVALGGRLGGEVARPVAVVAVRVWEKVISLGGPCDVAGVLCGDVVFWR
mmetsp:Transcript_2251/g.5841  ORF Transcript_2251/g.5841 Transcript_2251/m.5841 type:complete len:412 (-) Transcript_2251:1074-2309(-)